MSVPSIVDRCQRARTLGPQRPEFGRQLDQVESGKLAQSPVCGGSTFGQGGRVSETLRLGRSFRDGLSDLHLFRDLDQDLSAMIAKGEGRHVGFGHGHARECFPLGADR